MILHEAHTILSYQPTVDAESSSTNMFLVELRGATSRAFNVFHLLPFLRFLRNCKGSKTLRITVVSLENGTKGMSITTLLCQYVN